MFVFRNLLGLFLFFGMLGCLAVNSSAQEDRSPSARAAQRAHDVKSGWTLLWNDEFDQPGAPNPNYWSHEVNCWGGGNNERQCYTDRLENSYVDDQGYLHIVAKEELFTGPALQDDDPNYPGPLVTRAYTSARLRTKNKVDWRYGRIEIRAQLVAGRGMWPALWMLPTDWKYGGWPSSGEIDIVEAVNLPTNTYSGWGNVIHGTLHYGLPWPQWENHGASLDLDANPADGFHVYALEWDEDEIRWYFDGVHYQTQRSEGWYNYIWGGQDKGFVVANPRAPFDQNFHLLMNVAVGGDWPGSPDRGWSSDREMLIDYVRVYKCAQRAASVSQQACGTIDPAVETNTDIGTPGIHYYPLDFSPSSSTLTVNTGNSEGVGVIHRLGKKNTTEIQFYKESVFTSEPFTGTFSISHAEDRSFYLYGGSGWTNNGEIEFDIKVKDISPDTRLFVKLNSRPTGIASYELELPKSRNWQHVSIPIRDLLNNTPSGEAALNLRTISTLFAIEATGPAVLLLKNVEFQCAFNTEPEPWQRDKICGMLPVP